MQHPGSLHSSVSLHTVDMHVDNVGAPFPGFFHCLQSQRCRDVFFTWHGPRFFANGVLARGQVGVASWLRALAERSSSFPRRSVTDRVAEACALPRTADEHRRSVRRALS